MKVYKYKYKTRNRLDNVDIKSSLPVSTKANIMGRSGIGLSYAKMLIDLHGRQDGAQ